MKQRPFVGLVKTRLHYTLLPDLPSGPIEEVPSSKTATFFVAGSCNNNQMAVKAGDTVNAGQRMAPFADSDAYAVSTISGTIASIEPYKDAVSRDFAAITVNILPQRKWDESLGENPDLNAVIRHLECIPGGLCLKAFVDSEKSINTIVVLGMDQDILCTAVQQVVKEQGSRIAQGINALKKLTHVSRIIMVVPQYLASKAEDCEVKVVDTVYPNASPKMIMHKLLGKTVPAGKSPEDLGVLFLSAEAVAALGESCSSGRPCVDKIITLIDKDEKAVNIKVRIGTPIKDVLDVRRIMLNDKDRVILGGPMQGVATYSADLPVQPDTDAILVQDSDDLPEIKDSSCINCGECVRACPARMPVNMLVRLLENGLYEEAAEKYDLLSCVDCGLCSYVCTARIPIFQYIGLARHELDRLASEAQ